MQAYQQKTHFGGSNGPRLPARRAVLSRRLQPDVVARAAASQTRGPGIREMSNQMKAARSQMEENEQLRVLMNGFRGSNVDQSDFARTDVKMQLVEVSHEGDDEALPLVYEPEAINAYWDRRPVSVLTRICQLLSVSGSFLTSLIGDWARGRLRETEVQRAIQIREIVTSLGPAYIKLGQALSIRPDILSPAAMNELQKLCDKVPSFDNKLAMQVIQEELGRPWHEVYAELTPEPIAAASLGQVYKGKLKTGEIVAVKVQRPYVLETVTIDLYIIRKLGLFLRRFPQITTDVVALLDEWAARFFEELDYVNEGRNAELFAEQMKNDLPQVVVPGTFFEYTSRRVLTTQWLEGEKLSQSKADDVGMLVNIGVICYLKQLLDTGFFHADPHPGNLIRTPDGRLAILDFGLMTQVDDNIKYGMIEAISHLIHRDYDAIVKDFVTLDFIPEGTDLRPILPVLAKVFDQALAGGGAKSINFQELAADLAQITFDYPFRIPPYFALIIRAIGTLEGIALVGNPNFAIVDEAYPYIAKRLLTDDSPRLRAALKYMVYGREGIFDADRLIDLLHALEQFVESSQSARGSMDSMDHEAAAPNMLPGRAALPGFSTVEDPAPSTSGRQQPGLPFPFPPFSLPGLPGGSLTPAPMPMPVPALQGMLDPMGGLAALLPPTSLTRSLLMQQAQAQAGLEIGAGGLSGMTSSGSATRAALRFMLSPEGVFFREFMMDELVKSIDALSREQAVALLQRLGLAQLEVPLLLPGARRMTMPLAPTLSAEDRAVVDNLTKLVEFFTNGQGMSSILNPRSATFSADSVAVVSELMPVLPTVATEVLPQLGQRLTNRILARLVRELYV